jgi:hypothetical protein
VQFVRTPFDFVASTCLLQPFDRRALSGAQTISFAIIGRSEP